MGGHKHALYPFYERLREEFEEATQRDPTEAESFNLWRKAQEEFDQKSEAKADTARGAKER